MKLKHANSILETFEYFCLIPSKSIVTISSYTVSKLDRFYRAMHFSAKRSIVIACRLSVSPSVCEVGEL